MSFASGYDRKVPTLSITSIIAIALLSGTPQLPPVVEPVIALEMKGHGERYGWSDDRLNSFLNSLGYKEVDNIFDDSVFMPWET